MARASSIRRDTTTRTDDDGATKRDDTRRNATKRARDAGATRARDATTDARANARTIRFADATPRQHDSTTTATDDDARWGSRRCC